MFFGGKKKDGAAASDQKPGPANGKLDIQPLGAQPSQPAQPASADQSAPPQIDPAMLAKIAEVRAKLHETFGKVTLALLSTPRYRNLAISDLAQLVLDPLMRDRIAIATAAKDGAPIEGTLSGIAFWASVSEAVDAKIREQIKAGAFPVRLQPEDWNSGKINWLLDVIAPNQRLTTAVIANFRHVLPKTDAAGAVGDLRIHPIVTRLVDAETLKKMGAAPIKAGEAHAPSQPGQAPTRGGFPKM